MDNETWLIEEGERIINKKAIQGADSLTPLEKLIYCLWVADYGMRNAGDLLAVSDLYPEFLNEGHHCADQLGFSETKRTFSMSPKQLENEYFNQFDLVCDEIRTDLLKKGDNSMG